jgi:serine/threonine protein kinase
MFGLGATLFWVLTGESPHPKFRSVSQALKHLREVPARRLRDLRPDAPVELELLLQSMLDRDPVRRPTLPMTVSRILEAFCH